MSSIKLFSLANGLRVLIKPVKDSQVAVCNMLYHVGACNEEAEKTGLAHLFEHLMFGGSQHIAAYDKALQRVGGSNNAYTTSDVTNYYCVVPANNLETAFWLESDRMLGISYASEVLEAQRKVVMEEFKEHHLNRPYGDVWHKLLGSAYTTHPYRWPTIGLTLAHIEGFTMGDVRQFAQCHYRPDNAILTVVGGVEPEQVMGLCERWFGSISSPAIRLAKPRFIEPTQEGARMQEVTGDVPLNMLYRAYHIPGRGEVGYPTAMLLANMLGGGKSSALYKVLVQEKKLLSDVQVFDTETLHGALLVIVGELIEGISFEAVDREIMRVIGQLQDGVVGSAALAGAVSQVEAHHAFYQRELPHQAETLALAMLLGSPSFFEKEIAGLGAIAASEVARAAQLFLRPEGATILRYHKQ